MNNLQQTFLEFICLHTVECFLVFLLSINNFDELVCCILWHINSNGLFDIKSCLCVYIKYDLLVSSLLENVKQTRDHLFAHSQVVLNIAI